MKKLIVVCLLLCSWVSLVGAAHGENHSKEEKVYKAAVGNDGIQRVELLGGSYFFLPNRIIVKVDVPVELLVKKEPGVVPHNIVMKAPEAGMDFEVSLADKSKAVKFTPTKTGTYPFYCNKKLLFFESHREKGMEGVMEVTK